MMRPNEMKLFSKAARALCLAALVFTIAACKENRPPERLRVAPVNTAKSAAKDVPLEIKAIGEIEAYSSIAVKSQVSGPVQKVHFKEGQFVNKGAALFTIDPRPFEVELARAQAQLARDRAQLENAVADAGRYEELVKKGYVAQSQYEQFRTAAEALKATVKADSAAVDNAKIQLGYCVIRSPINGRTGDLSLDEGNIVKANDDKAMVTIYQIEPIYARFTVPERTLPDIKRYMARQKLSVYITPQGEPAPINGELTFVDNTVDPQTGTILLKGTFRNSDRRLWPGQFTAVTLRLAVEQNAVTVPSQAVLTGQKGQYVFVVKPDMSVESRPVTVERTHGDDSVVTAGLKADETVVTDGQLQLVPGMKVQIKGEQQPQAQK